MNKISLVGQGRLSTAGAMRSRIAVFGLLSMAFGVSAGAQNMEGAVRVRGTVRQVTLTSFTLDTREKTTLELVMSPKVTVQYYVPLAFEEIKPGSIVGSTGMPDSGGDISALEVRMFEPGTGGPPEGQRPSDLKPGSVLTNGAVLEVGSVPHHRFLKLHCGTDIKTIAIPDGVPILTYQKADQTAVKAGAKVYVHYHPVDGKLETISIAVGKDGLTPPI